MYDEMEAPLMCRIFGHKIKSIKSKMKPSHGRRLLVPYCTRCGYSFLADGIALNSIFRNKEAMMKDANAS